MPPAKKSKTRRPAAATRPTGRKAKPKAVAKRATAAAKKPRAASAKTTRAAAPKTTRRAAAKAVRGAAQPQRIFRRAIFIDVENTSSEDALSEVLESLNIDRAAQPTELTAVGNWRAVGQRLARHLGSLGAQLVHSAPALGVRDWSDLWIAVAAGCWLGRAEPGDVLEIVSNDRAFDAVGDAAAARGVVYRRLLHKRGGTEVVTTAPDQPKPSARRSRGGRRRRRGGSGVGRSEHAPAVAASAAAHAPPPRQPRQPASLQIEPHGATREQIMGVIGRLTSGDPARWVNLDVLEKALKNEGFSRPPGSPRLVTRLRMIKEVEIDSHGRARLSPGAAPPAPPPSSAAPDGDAPEAADETSEAKAPAKRRRRRRSKSAASSKGDETAAAPAVE